MIKMLNLNLENNLKKFELFQRPILIVLLFISLLITVQNIVLGFEIKWAGQYTFYNNFIIFKTSFFHLLENKNLYIRYPNEYDDLYKYSPTFALLMGSFSFFHEYISLFLWNGLNIIVLYFAITKIYSIHSSKKILLILFIIFELILSVQNSQSNALLVGLTIIAFNKLESNKNTHASFFIVIGTFIKIYSILGCILFLFYPNKIKSIITFLLWFVLFLLLPLLFIDFNSLIWQYNNWFDLLKIDQNSSIGMSAYKFSQLILPSKDYKLITLLIGTCILFLPLLRFKQFSINLFRLHYLSLLLIWMVVFNYKAESPTYIIAMTGIGMWFFSSKQSNIKIILITLTLFFTSLWFTDLVPEIAKEYFFDKQFVKTMFPLLILFYITFELTFKRTSPLSSN